MNHVGLSCRANVWDPDYSDHIRRITEDKGDSEINLDESDDFDIKPNNDDIDSELQYSVE